MNFLYAQFQERTLYLVIVRTIQCTGSSQSTSHVYILISNLSLNVTGSAKRGLITFPNSQLSIGESYLLTFLSYHLHISLNNSAMLGVYQDQVSKLYQIHKSSYEFLYKYVLLASSLLKHLHVCLIPELCLLKLSTCLMYWVKCLTKYTVNHWSDYYLNVLSVHGILVTALMWYLKCSYFIEPVSFANIAGQE